MEDMSDMPVQRTLHQRPWSELSNRVFPTSMFIGPQHFIHIFHEGIFLEDMACHAGN